MKIGIAGTGYVGLSLSTLLSQKNEVVALDVIEEKVEKINKRINEVFSKASDALNSKKNDENKADLQQKLQLLSERLGLKEEH